MCLLACTYPLCQNHIHTDLPPHLSSSSGYLRGCLLGFVVVQSLTHVWLFVTPWIAAHQAPLSSIISQSLLTFISIESVMLSNYLILCCPLLLLPLTFPSTRVFSNESTLCIKLPKYWRFSFSISSSKEYSGLISLRIHWFDLLAVRGTLKSLLHCWKASVLLHSVFFMVQLSHCTHWAIVVARSLSRVWRFVTTWTAAWQASLSFTILRSLLKLLSIKSMMPSNQLILCHLFLFLPSNFPGSGSFTMSQPHQSIEKYWSGQSIEVSVSASVLAMNIQGLFPLGLTG